MCITAYGEIPLNAHAQSLFLLLLFSCAYVSLCAHMQDASFCSLFLAHLSRETCTSGVHVCKTSVGCLKSFISIPKSARAAVRVRVTEVIAQRSPWR